MRPQFVIRARRGRHSCFAGPSFVIAAALAAAAPALDFSQVAAIEIPEGEVASISTLAGDILWTGKRLPYDAEVEWIEANDTGGTAQYIDTLCNVAVDTIVEARWYQTGNGVQQRLFGVNDGDNQIFACYINGNKRWAANTGTSSGGVIGSAPGSKLYQGSFNLGTGVCKINTSTLGNGGTPFSTTNTIPIFARKNIGVAIYADYPATMRLYWFRITQNGVLVRDFLPVRKDGEGCLYDRVSGELYRNRGTGAFAAGPDK